MSLLELLRPKALNLQLHGVLEAGQVPSVITSKDHTGGPKQTLSPINFCGIPASLFLSLFFHEAL